MKKIVSPYRARLIAHFGSLRLAAKKTGIRYQRLSDILNFWINPTVEEIKIIDHHLRNVRGGK